MLDQNTTTIITAAFTVIGTLGGAFGGVVLSNRHTAKMEHLRIEQEKLKRNTVIIEEVYALLIKVCARLDNNINHERGPMEGIEPDLHRLEVLVFLYLPSIKHKYGLFVNQMIQFATESYDSQQSKNPSDAREEVEESFIDFNNKLTELKEGLEKLVR